MADLGKATVLAMKTSEVDSPGAERRRSAAAEA